MELKDIRTITESDDLSDDAKVFVAQTETVDGEEKTVFRQVPAGKVGAKEADGISYDNTENDLLSSENVQGAIDELTVALTALGFSWPRYGVSGVGGSAAALTRLWDAEGKTATAGTDTEEAASDFDGCYPFERKKCVGSWALSEDGDKAVFTVNAYYGDADYAEDGSMGNFVAYEVKPFYWYHDYSEATDMILGVSPGKNGTGWEYHPVCLDRDGNVRENTYLACYELAVDGDGLPVSLPGYHPQSGSYYALRNTARKYLDGLVADYAMLDTTAIWHYNWLLMTIEFATQNMQNVMYGAASNRYNAADVITTAPADNQLVVTATIGGYFYVGQTIYIGATYSTTPSGVDAYNIITAKEACDADGTLNADGEYILITYSGTSRDVTDGTTTISSRPWITGTCTGYNESLDAVLGHTGSPVSNTSGKYPCMYRWLENPYGNINKTTVDLMNARVTDDDGNYYLEWYYLDDPASYMPSSASYPNQSDLDTYWEKMDTITPVESYVNGYLKEFGYDDDKPWVPIPVLTSGGSASTYYCDYASLVAPFAVRAVRRGGYVNYGAAAGPCYMNANNAPSDGTWYFGGGLQMIR